jgi:hypothetical protein
VSTLVISKASDLSQLANTEARIILLYCTREEARQILAEATRLKLTGKWILQTQPSNKTVFYVVDVISQLRENICMVYVAYQLYHVLHYTKRRYNEIELLCIFLFPIVQQPPSGSGPPHYWGFTVTHRHTTLGRIPLYEWRPNAEISTWQNTTQKRQTFILPAEFEPAIPASERRQTHASYRAATGNVSKLPHFTKIVQTLKFVNAF